MLKGRTYTRFGNIAPNARFISRDVLYRKAKPEEIQTGEMRVNCFSIRSHHEGSLRSRPDYFNDANVVVIIGEEEKNEDICLR